MLIKVNQNELWNEQKIEDKNNKSVKNRPGSTKIYDIHNQRNYDMNPTPFTENF